MMQNDVKIDNLDDNENIKTVSKSQRKRDSWAITQLGKRLTRLSTAQLAEIPLDEPVREAIAFAHKIQNKRSALKRHLLFLGKLLRSRDTDAIVAAVKRFDSCNQLEIQRHQQAARWRDQIIEQGFEAIEIFVSQKNQADRQRLRQLWRNYAQAQTNSKKQQSARQIYQDVKRALDHL